MLNERGDVVAVVCSTQQVLADESLVLLHGIEHIATQGTSLAYLSHAHWLSPTTPPPLFRRRLSKSSSTHTL
jgi:hypothetical protein